MYRFLILAIILFIAGCSGSVNTSDLNSQEHFDYALKLYEDEDYLEAVSELQSVLLQYPGSAVNDDAQYYLGMTYFEREQFLLAAYEYSKLIRDIPASSFVPESQYMLAESYYKLSPPFQLDQAYTKKAIEEFQAFIDFFPTHEKVAEAENKIKEMNEKLALKEFNSGEIYEKMQLTTAALKYYELVVNTYHDTKYAPLALYNKIQLHLSRNEESEAAPALREFLAKYPNHERALEIKELQTQFSLQ